MVLEVPSDVVRLLNKRANANQHEAALEVLCTFVSENIRAFWHFEPAPVPIYPYGFRTVTTQNGCRRAGAKGHE